MLQGKDEAEYDRIYQRWAKERFTGEWWTVSEVQESRIPFWIHADNIIPHYSGTGDSKKANSKEADRL